MRATTDNEAAKRFRLALDLFDASVAMLRQRLRREHPRASKARIDELVQGWLWTRPGAERGDGVGRSVSWPRRRR